MKETATPGGQTQQEKTNNKMNLILGRDKKSKILKKHKNKRNINNKNININNSVNNNIIKIQKHISHNKSVF